MKATPTRHVEYQHTDPGWIENSKVVWRIEDEP